MSAEPGTSLAPIDFSKEAIEREVLSRVAGDPIATTAAAVGVVGLLATWLLGWPLWLGAPLILSGGVYGFNFLRRDALKTGYLQQLNMATRNQSKALATYINGEFEELKFPRGQKQIELLLKNLDVIKRLLQEKFTKGDMSYEQFLGPAETLVAKTLNLLKDAAAQLRANQSHDQDYDRATGKLSKDSGDIKRRSELYEQGVTHFNELIEKAESAITGLAELTHDVARIGSDAGSHADFIQRVKDIASRAGLYVDEKKI